MRQPRITFPEIPHHVTQRANNRRLLFSYPREYQLYIMLLERGLSLFPNALHGAVLMSNHVHLIITPPTEKSLSQLMKYTNQSYAQLRNARRGGSGRLFEERFDADPILSEAHLAATTAYVELNPVRAGVRAEARAYRWSTYGWHVDEACAFPSIMWTPSPWYQSLGESRSERADEYRRWLGTYQLSGERPPKLSSADRRVLGARLRRPDGKSAA